MTPAEYYILLAVCALAFFWLGLGQRLFIRWVKRRSRTPIDPSSPEPDGERYKRLRKEWEDKQ